MKRDYIGNAGALRFQLTLQRKQRSPDELGGRDSVWVTVYNVWANRRPASSGETFRAHQLKQTISEVVDCRYDPNIKVEDMRFLAQDGTVLAITGIINEGSRDRMMTIGCDTRRDMEEGAAQ